MISTDKLMMAEIPAWVSALKISDEDYLEWITIFPSPEFILSWAIESTRVDEKAYLKWATSYYKLPVVKPDFFQKSKPPLEMWKKYVHGPWSPTVLPLYEYKETLFVGVLEPKNFSLNAGVKVQLVLSPSTLQNPWWHLYSQLRKETIPQQVVPVAQVDEERAQSARGPEGRAVSPEQKPVVTPPPPPSTKAEDTETFSSAPLTLEENTQTNTGRGIFVIDKIDRPATPLGLEDNEIIPEEQNEFQVEINSPNPAALEEPKLVTEEKPEEKKETPPSEIVENTGKFAKVSAKALEGAPESVAHALEILKAARAAAKPPQEFTPLVPQETLSTITPDPASTPEVTSLKPIDMPPLPREVAPPPLPSPSPIAKEAVAEIVAQPKPPQQVVPVAPPAAEVTAVAPVAEITAAAPIAEVTIVPVVELPTVELPTVESATAERPAVELPKVVEPPQAVMPPLPPPPPVSVAQALPPMPPPPPGSAAEPPPLTQLASELLKPEKKLDLSTSEEPSKVTKIRTNTSRKDTSIGFDDLVAPVIKDNVSPDGISFDLTSIPPPPPVPDKFETDALPDGLGGGLELIDKSPRSITPEGLGAIEIPKVEVGKLENLISDDLEIELPDLNFEKQQTLMDDLNTAVRNSTLSPTHQGSTPTAATPLTSQPQGAAGTVKPTVTGPAGQNVEEIVFTGVPEGSIKAVLEKLKSVYERGMVLLRQEGRLRAYQWDPSWPLDVTEKGDVELAINSLFKIVVDSKHPFHGAARPALPNDRFFKKWNKNQYPACVTALPLKAHDEVFGVLLAVANADKASTIILQDWEKVAAELSSELAKQIGAAA